MNTKTLNPVKIEFKGQFAVSPDYTQERTGNYERRDKIAAKWLNAPANSVIDGNGNCNHQFCFDVKKQTLNNWKSDYPEFFASLKEGKVLADGRLLQACITAH